MAAGASELSTDIVLKQAELFTEAEVGLLVSAGIVEGLVCRRVGRSNGRRAEVRRADRTMLPASSDITWSSVEKTPRIWTIDTYSIHSEQLPRSVIDS